MDKTSSITVETYFSTIYIILCCASIISHMVVKLTISRNNILKKTPLYVYILSIMLNNALFLAWSLILHTNSDVLSGSFDLFHVPMQIFMIFQAGNILTLIALTLKYPVRRDNYIRFILGIWIAIIVFSIIFIITYFTLELFIYNLVTVIIMIEFLVLLVLHVACRVIYRKERGDYALQLNLVSLYISCYILYNFWWFISFVAGYTHVFKMLLAYTGVYTCCYGVVNAISLVFFDRNYRICFLETIKCSKTKYFDTHETEMPNETLLSHNPS